MADGRVILLDALASCLVCHDFAQVLGTEAERERLVTEFVAEHMRTCNGNVQVSPSWVFVSPYDGAEAQVRFGPDAVQISGDARE